MDNPSIGLFIYFTSIFLQNLPYFLAICWINPIADPANIIGNLEGIQTIIDKIRTINVRLIELRDLLPPLNDITAIEILEHTEDVINGGNSH